MSALNEKPLGQKKVIKVHKKKSSSLPTPWSEGSALKEILFKTTCEQEPGSVKVLLTLTKVSGY